MTIAAALPAVPRSGAPTVTATSTSIPNPFDVARDRIVDAVRGLLQGIVEDFTRELVAPVSRFVLHTPDLLGEPTLRRLWGVSLSVLFVVAGLLVAISGTAMIAGRSSRFGMAAREAVGTRLAGSMLTAAVSLPVVALEVQLGNRIVDAFLSDGLDTGANPLWKTLGTSVTGDVSAGLALLITSLVAVVLLVVLVVLGLARWATLWLLVVLAPVAMGFSLLPGGAGVARTWWRLQIVAVFLPVANAVLLATYVAMFSSEKSGLVGALSGIAVLALMAKLPAWAAGAAIGIDGHDLTSRVQRARSSAVRVARVASAATGRSGAANAASSARGKPGGGAPQGHRGSGHPTGHPRSGRRPPLHPR